jgi:hypothetical protein
MTTTIRRTAPWSAIESEELDSKNWIQVAFRFEGFMEDRFREYRVFGELAGVPFSEHYYSAADDNKRLAYDFYWEQLDKLEA